MRGIGLRAKVAVLVSCLLAAVIAINAFMTIHTERRELERQLREQGALFARLTSTDVVRTFGSIGVVPEVLEKRMSRFFEYYPDLVRLMIISESGRVLYDSAAHPVSEPTAPSTDDPELLRRMKLKGQDVREYTEPDGSIYMDILMPPANEGPRFIKVRYIISYESLEKRLGDIRADFVKTAGVFIVLGILVAVVFSTKMTGPILRMKDGAVGIAAGNLDQSVEVSGTDELAELGRSFNMMARSLKQHRESLEKANRDLVEANDGLRRLQDELVRSERMAAVGQLAAGLSHEIDNPIGVILGFAEILHDELPEDDPRREDLATIIAESRRCKRIVRGLLDFSRPPSLGMSETDVNDLIRRTVETARAQRVFRDVELSVRTDVRTPVMTADGDRLRQVFMNLLLNAAQAMPDGGMLDISTVYDDAAGMVEVSFEDTGAGIKPSDMEHIFEPFFTTKRPGEGTGLGLAICRRLIEEQGGSISAHSEPGKGSVFTVTLRVNPGAAGPENAGETLEY